MNDPLKRMNLRTCCKIFYSVHKNSNSNLLEAEWTNVKSNFARVNALGSTVDQLICEYAVSMCRLHGTHDYADHSLGKSRQNIFYFVGCMLSPQKVKITVTGRTVK